MSAQRRTIMRYFALLVLAVVATLGLVLGLTFSRYQGEAEARARLQEFNLRSLVLATEVSTGVAEVSEVVAGAEVVDGAFAEETSRKLSNGVFLISQGTAELSLLQEASGQTSFATTLARAELHAGELTAFDAAETASVDDWQRQLVAMDLAMTQLRRLHSIAAESELQQIESRSNQARGLAAVLVPLAFLVGGAVVSRLYVLVRRRLADLDRANEHLLEARHRIEQSRRLDALATLVGGAAHDFNNLLMVIRLQAEIGQTRLAPDDPTAETLRRIQTAADQATDTTRQLLSFGRNDAPRLEDVHLGRRVHDLEPVLRGLLRADIDLEITEIDNVGAVSIDPVQIDQIFMNLVLNGRDAMWGRGSVSITISDVDLGVDAEGIPPGPYCRICVEDTGVGMSPEIQDRAFDPFFTTKGGERGTGLGLSMVHGIVTKAGGHIRLHSASGVGTSVDLYLPRVEATALEPSHVKRPECHGHGFESILVVDDERQIRELLSSGLGEHGYRVFSAAGASEALELRREIGSQLDLILTDVVMPEMRGPDLVALLSETYPNVGAIYMSGYIEDAVLDSVLGSGDRFVPKPFELQHIVGVVREHLDTQPSKRLATIGRELHDPKSS